MPSSIVKCDPDVDLYMNWSTVVDAPTFIGTEAEMRTNARMLRRGEIEDQRFERAQRTGTSALWPTEDDPDMGWRDSGACVMNGTHRGWLPRRNFLAFAQQYPDVGDLLEPFEHDEGTSS